MLDPNVSLDWTVAAGWLAVIAAAGFSISWLLTDVSHVRRATYVGALILLTAALTAGFVMGSDQGSAFWTRNWGWGLLGAAVTGLFLAGQIRRIRVTGIHAHHPTAGQDLWEGLVYGTAEGLLLSVLPVVVVWQAFTDRGWTGGWARTGAGVAALAASALVIGVHHLGYREFRNRKIAQALLACLVLSLGYLLTGSPIAPIGGHVVLHLALLQSSIELPPAYREEPQTRSHPEREPAMAR
jgi:hypothetical protein